MSVIIIEADMTSAVGIGEAPCPICGMSIVWRSDLYIDGRSRKAIRIRLYSCNRCAWGNEIPKAWREIADVIKMPTNNASVLQ